MRFLVALFAYLFVTTVCRILGEMLRDLHVTRSQYEIGFFSGTVGALTFLYFFV